MWRTFHVAALGHANVCPQKYGRLCGGCLSHPHAYNGWPKVCGPCLMQAASHAPMQTVFLPPSGGEGGRIHRIAPSQADECGWPQSGGNLRDRELHGAWLLLSLKGKTSIWAEPGREPLLPTRSCSHRPHSPFFRQERRGEHQCRPSGPASGKGRSSPRRLSPSGGPGGGADLNPPGAPLPLPLARRPPWVALPPSSVKLTELLPKLGLCRE